MICRLTLLYPRQGFELMERRRRRQRPFQSGRAHAPRIVAGDALLHEGFRHAEQEHQHAEAGDVGAVGRDLVPAVERFRIVDRTARHAGEAEEVLREEDDVDADEGDPEVRLADRLIVHVAGDLRELVAVSYTHLTLPTNR